MQQQANISAQEVERRLSAIYDMLWTIAAAERTQQQPDNSTESITDNIISLDAPSYDDQTRRAA